MTLSNSVYRSFNMATISMGVESEDRLVKPTMSLKKIVTDSKVSGSMFSPLASFLATTLGNILYNRFSMFALADASSAVRSPTLWTEKGSSVKLTRLLVICNMLIFIYRVQYNNVSKLI